MPVTRVSWNGIRPSPHDSVKPPVQLRAATGSCAYLPEAGDGLPLAPSRAYNRLADPDTVDVFLTLNCKLTFKRECTVPEKGDVLTWLIY